MAAPVVPVVPVATAKKEEPVEPAAEPVEPAVTVDSDTVAVKLEGCDSDEAPPRGLGGRGPGAGGAVSLEPRGRWGCWAKGQRGASKGSGKHDTQEMGLAGDGD